MIDCSKHAKRRPAMHFATGSDRMTLFGVTNQSVQRWMEVREDSAPCGMPKECRTSTDYHIVVSEARSVVRWGYYDNGHALCALTWEWECWEERRVDILEMALARRKRWMVAGQRRHLVSRRLERLFADESFELLRIGLIVLKKSVGESYKVLWLEVQFILKVVLLILEIKKRSSPWLYPDSIDLSIHHYY